MKRISTILNSGLLTAPILMAAMLASCSMFHDDLPECAVRPTTRATVNFIYDYNTSETDAFAEHIGSITLYAFDSEGKLVLRQEHTVDAHGINAPGYSMPIELPEGHYTLYASARATTAGYEAAIQMPGAKFRRSADGIGTPLADLFYTLDHQNGIVDHGGVALEDMWLTREGVPFDMTVAPMPSEGDPQPADILLTATVPLQRVTNHINLTISRALVTRTSDRAEPLLPEEYDVKIVTQNASDRLDLLGNPMTNGIPLTYTPHNIAPSTGSDGNPALTANISTSRLMHEDNATEHTKLVITAKNSGETFTYDLPALLAEGKKAPAYSDKNWNEQEYLDREYNYEISVNFDEKDRRWKYIEVKISILNWAKRIQNVDL